jgi:hypothetical protein
MRTCSHCRRAFPDGARTCPFCGTFLLALHAGEASEEPRAAQAAGGADNLVVIARCRTRWESDFVRTLLESEGIATAQKPSAAGEAWSYIPSFTGTIEILVTPEDEEEARNILLSGRQDAPGE